MNGLGVVSGAVSGVLGGAISIVESWGNWYATVVKCLRGTLPSGTLLDRPRGRSRGRVGWWARGWLGCCGDGCGVRGGRLGEGRTLEVDLPVGVVADPDGGGVDVAGHGGSVAGGGLGGLVDDGGAVGSRLFLICCRWWHSVLELFHESIS